MQILLTKTLPVSNIDLLKSFHWDFDVVNALDIALVKIEKLPTDNADAWIVSSRNSLPVLEKFIEQAPPIIYCIGQWMGNKLKQIFPPERILTYKKMNDLVIKLQKQNHQHLLYFCADNHRGELEEGLQGTSSLITKIITHESRLTYPTLQKQYDAIFVFSPRSVESLLQNNTFDTKTIFACIGSTTVSYLHEQGVTNTFCASYPDSEILIEEFHLKTLTLTH